MLPAINLFLGGLNLGLFMAFGNSLNGLAAAFCFIMVLVQGRKDGKT